MVNFKKLIVPINTEDINRVLHDIEDEFFVLEHRLKALEKKNV